MEWDPLPGGVDPERPLPVYWVPCAGRPAEEVFGAFEEMRATKVTSTSQPEWPNPSSESSARSPAENT
jgi:hypothetical protein